MKTGFNKCAVLVLFAASAIFAGCSMVNVPNEDLRKAMPPDPAKEIKDASIKFITANYKLYSCVGELDTALRMEGGGSDPDTASEILGYAREFVADTETALKEIADWSVKNSDKLGELILKAKDLKKWEQGALINFRALADGDFQTKQAAYIESVRAYLEVAGRMHEFLKTRYPDLVLGIGDAQDLYNGQIVELEKAMDVLNERLNDVASLFRVLLKSKAELMGLTQEDKAAKDEAGKLP